MDPLVEQMKLGKKVWVIPDGELPRKSPGSLDSHESVMILNPNEEDVVVNVTIYFKDQNPVENVSLTVGAKRMFDFRVDRPEEFGGFEMPEGKPYSLLLRAEWPIVVQHSRLMSVGDCFGLFTTIPYFQEEV